jgi:hypothetical protein
LENFSPEFDNVGPFPSVSFRADFDGFGKATAFASGQPGASTDGNEGKNLGQTQQRIIGNVEVHDTSPCVLILGKHIIGFFLTTFTRANETTG